MDLFQSSDFFLLPYSIDQTDDQIIDVGNKILHYFKLHGRVVLVHSDAKDALCLERQLRCNWWVSLSDNLRYAMHNCGMQIFDVVEQNLMAKNLLDEAWLKAENISSSLTWRRHYQKLIEDDAGSKEFLQVFFRLSQQILSRAARYEAIFPQKLKSGYSYLYELVVSKTLPLGFYNNSLYLQKIRPGDNDEYPLIIDIKKQERYKNMKKVFLCYEFKKEGEIQILQTLLENIGYELEFGPLDERHSPVEGQLARIIRNSAFVVVMIDRVDDDFGLPVWIFQEIDLAIYFQIPVIFFTSSNNNPFSSDRIHFVHTKAATYDLLYREITCFLERINKRRIQIL